MTDNHNHSYDDSKTDSPQLSLWPTENIFDGLAK